MALRVPTADAQRIFDQLNRSGQLKMLIAVMRDIADVQKQFFWKAVRTHLVLSQDQLCELQACQTRIDEIERLITIFEALAAQKAPPPPPLPKSLS